MDKETSTRIEKTKAPLWKKVLIWSAAILSILTVLGIAITMAIKKTGPSSAVKDILNKARAAEKEAELDAKLKKAEALRAEEKVLKELKEIKEIKDEEERARRLADLF